MQKGRLGFGEKLYETHMQVHEAILVLKCFYVLKCNPFIIHKYLENANWTCKSLKEHTDSSTSLNKFRIKQNLKKWNEENLRMKKHFMNTKRK